MRNPLRDEASAFQVVWLTLAGAAVVVAASYLSPWLGLAVFLALLAAATWAIRGGLRDRGRTHVVRAVGAERRILVVANETVGADELTELLVRRALRERRGGAGRVPCAELAPSNLGLGRGRRT